MINPWGYIVLLIGSENNNEIFTFESNPDAAR